MIYAHDADGLYVNLFIGSDLDWKDRGVRIRQETSFPAQAGSRIRILQTHPQPWTLRIRIPGWAEGARVRVNGAAVGAMAEPGSYLQLLRHWKGGDFIEIDLPMTLSVEPFTDAPDTVALVYGPVVLAQQLPKGTIPEKLLNEQGPDVAKAPPPAVPAVLPADIVARLSPVPGQSLTFALTGPQGSVLFKPVSESWERFAVYSKLAAG
jgi:DUF1680 family protein